MEQPEAANGSSAETDEEPDWFISVQGDSGSIATSGATCRNNMKSRTTGHAGRHLRRYSNKSDGSITSLEQTIIPFGYEKHCGESAVKIRFEE